MPIETICQGCARKLRVPDEHAGKKARCPQCRTTYIVPGVSQSAADSPVDRPHHIESPTRDQPKYATNAERDRPGSDRWQVRTPDGRLYGPVPRAELDQWYAEGRIPGNAQLLRSGEHQWVMAAEVYPDLGVRSGRLSVQHNPFAEHATRVRPGNPFASPGTGHLLPHRGGVILTLGVLGWAVCFVFAPIAWAMGQSDVRAMRAGRMDPAGMSLTQMGMILGMIETILVLVGVVFLIVASVA